MAASRAKTAGLHCHAPNMGRLADGHKSPIQSEISSIEFYSTLEIGLSQYDPSFPSKIMRSMLKCIILFRVVVENDTNVNNLSVSSATYLLLRLSAQAIFMSRIHPIKSILM